MVFDPIKKTIVAARASLLLDDQVSATPLLSLSLEERSDLRSAVGISGGLLLYSRALVKTLTVDELKQTLQRLAIRFADDKGRFKPAVLVIGSERVRHSGRPLSSLSRDPYESANANRRLM